jgi:hypothetical protein
MSLAAMRAKPDCDACYAKELEANLKKQESDIARQLLAAKIAANQGRLCPLP